MSGGGDVLYGPKPALLERLPFHLGERSSPHKPRIPSATDLQTRLPGLVLVWDWLGIAAAGLLIDVLIDPGVAQPSRYLDIVLGATLTVNYLHLLRGYCVPSMRKVAVQVAKASLAWLGAFASLALIGYMAGYAAEFGEAWAGLWFAGAWLFICATRWLVGSMLSRWQKDGRLARRIAVLGAGQTASVLARRLQAHGEEAAVVGLFAESSGAARAGENTGNLDLLTSLANAGEVDEVILAPSDDPSTDLRQIMTRLAQTQVEVKIYPQLPNLGFPVQGFSKVAGISALTIQARPLAGWGAPLKRAEDIVLTSILLVLLAPLLLLVAVLIKLDSPGPVIFRQERHGFNNNRFRVFKFRTMHHEPDPDPSVPQARRNDPRVTRVGAVLRSTSLDELPQLFNVLRGDMSLVGPRPHATAHNDKYAPLIDGYLARHRVRPGMTGWAQVNGWRGETDTLEKMRNRLEHDLFYIANWSLLLDLKVLLLTLPVIMRGTNAY